MKFSMCPFKFGEVTGRGLVVMLFFLSVATEVLGELRVPVMHHDGRLFCSYRSLLIECVRLFHFKVRIWLWQDG